ncbi:MAG TPA: helix-turn-helix transcriptional regulator [Candidatus Faecaligallichristensenella faecipullorum]|nr:helix-turn-helix transcriptional regulator [Candidatus Faecaligallichristensenella faecipullorum]
MKFGEKLRELRRSEHMTQTELANQLGVTMRTLQNYESGRIYPKNSSIYGKIADRFNVSVDYLLSDEDHFIQQAEERGGARSRREVQELLSELGGLFAGGELSQEDKDQVMLAINDLYWVAKERNRKYIPRKYRSEDKESD